MKKEQIFNLIIFITGITLMMLMIHKVGWKKIGEYLDTLGPNFLFILAAGTITLLFDSTAFSLATGAKKKDFLHVLGISLAGMTINAYTPSGDAGEIVKGNLLRGIVSSEKIISGVLVWNLVFKITKKSIAFVAALTSFFMVGSIKGANFSYKTALILSGAALAAFLPVMLLWVFINLIGVERLIRFVKKIPYLGKKIPEKWLVVASLTDTRVKEFRNENKKNYRLIYLNIFLGRISEVFEWWFAIIFLGHFIPLPVAFILYAGGTVVDTILTISPVQLGAIEASNYYMFSLLGFNPSIGFAQALVRRLRMFIFNIFGILYLGYRSLPSNRK